MEKIERQEAENIPKKVGAAVLSGAKPGDGSKLWILKC